MIKDNLYYKLKYLKYKNKYINYKNLIGGLITSDNIGSMDRLHPVDQHDPIQKGALVSLLPSTPLQQQEIIIGNIFREMYPEHMVLPTILLNVLRGDQESINKRIRFVIAIRMEFRTLSEDKLSKIMKYVYEGTVFTDDEILHSDIQEILQQYFKDVYIPDFIIDLLDQYNTYIQLQEKICKKISEIQTQFPYIQIIANLFCNTQTLDEISKMYIIDNDALFIKLVNTIKEEESYDSIKILGLFIDIVKRSTQSIESKINVLDKIEKLLKPLYDKYMKKKLLTCNPLIHTDKRFKIPQECFKFKHAHQIYIEVQRTRQDLNRNLQEKHARRIFSEMYPEYNGIITLNPLIDSILSTIKLDLLTGPQESINKRIKFIIAIRMEFRTLSQVDLSEIMKYVYKGNVLQIDDTLDLDIARILRLYFENVYIPEIIIELFENDTTIYSYEILLQKICKNIAMLKTKFSYIDFISNLDCSNLSTLNSINGMYISGNTEFFKKLVDSIKDEDSPNSNIILRSFIDLVQRSNLSIEIQFSIINKIDLELVKLHDEYVNSWRCKPSIRKRGLVFQQCHKLRNAYKYYKIMHITWEEYEKRLKQILEKQTKKEEKDSKLRDKFQEESRIINEKLKSILLQINLLFKKEYDKGITSNTQLLANMIIAIEIVIESIKQEFNEKKIPITGLSEDSLEKIVKKDVLHKNVEIINEELKELLLQINLLFENEYIKRENMLKKCLHVIELTEDKELKEQLTESLKKIDQSQKIVTKQQNIGAYNGILTRFNLTECIPVTSNTVGLSKMLLAIELAFKPIQNQFNKYNITV
jgi:hypothetical protein